MHWNDFLIGQVIAECHSFPNMYDMLKAKVDRLAGKTYFVQKTPKNSLSRRQGIWVAWLWEELYAKLLALGQLLGCPWKLWSITQLRCPKMKSFRQFWSDHLETNSRIEHVLQYWDSRFFSFPEWRSDFIFGHLLIFCNKTDFFLWPHFEPPELGNGVLVTQTDYIFWILSA